VIYNSEGRLIPRTVNLVLFQAWEVSLLILLDHFYKYSSQAQVSVEKKLQERNENKAATQEYLLLTGYFKYFLLSHVILTTLWD
jgi:hypothetical protein